MIQLLNKIDRYLSIQEKKERIYSSFNDMELEEAINIFKNSDNKDETLLLFSEEIKNKIIILKEGGII